jgi:hypothetical protein
MRALQFLAVPLLATMAIAACEDGAPTSTARASTRASTAMDMGHSAAAGGFTVQVLSRSSFPDDIDATFRIKLDGARKRRQTKVVHVTDPSDVVVAQITLQPGGSLGWHTHPGPAIASVAAGELTILDKTDDHRRATDCVTRRYAAGTAFVEVGQGHVHLGFNATAGETVVYVTFLDVPAGQSPLIAASDPGC